MKTIKITDQLHKDILMLKAEYGLKTIAETIRFLQIYYKQEHSKYVTKK